MKYYSASTRGLYVREINGDAIPTDAVELSDEQYEAILGAGAANKLVVPDTNGRPTLVDPLSMLSLDQRKAAKLAELADACGARMAAIKAGYPQDEISTWDKQESEAREYKRTGGTAPTPLLSALSSARGVTLADLVDRVIAKADAFATISGATIGKRQKYEDQVVAATDAAGVATIAWVD